MGVSDGASHQPALGYMEVVQRRNAATLLPIIQAHTAPESIIHSDEWAAYRQVSDLPTVAAHNTVSHSLNFVDPVSGTHTQNVESYWSSAYVCTTGSLYLQKVILCHHLLYFAHRHHTICYHKRIIPL